MKYKRDFLFLVSTVISYFTIAFAVGYMVDFYLLAINIPIATIVSVFVALVVSLYSCYLQTNKPFS